MMKKLLKYLFLLLFITFSFFSCQNPSIDDMIEEYNKTFNIEEQPSASSQNNLFEIITFD